MQNSAASANQVRFFRITSVLGLFVDDGATETVLVLDLWWLKVQKMFSLNTSRNFADSP